tara:strand:- start:747 stop:1067 length:321 start_codon:yes stop_codon:yes gene_type:complete
MQYLIIDAQGIEYYAANSEERVHIQCDLSEDGIKYTTHRLIDEETLIEQERQRLKDEIAESWEREKNLTQMHMDGYARYRDIYPRISNEQQIRYRLEKEIQQLDLH